MDKKYLAERFDSALYGVCPKIKKFLIDLPQNVKSQTQEIRIRVNQPVALTTYGTHMFIGENGGVSFLPRNKSLTASAADIRDSFEQLCSFSVHTHQQEIKQGFIIMKGGHRAGICGTVVHENGVISTQREISSINIRIAREIFGCANQLVGLQNKGGILITGGPGSGKTTILRDLIRQLSSGCSGNILRVAVIDSRGEIAACSGGVSQNNLGFCSDIITGCPKAKGIEMAVRTLSPDIVAFDEIGSVDEIHAVEESLNCGTTVITTIHAGSINELLRRKQAIELLESGAIASIVTLEKPIGSSVKIYSVEEIYAKSNRTDSSGSGVFGGRDYEVVPTDNTSITA